MSRDLFISYSKQDISAAEMICSKLEIKGITCWIAPRDISPGADFDASILDGIDDSKTFLLILSKSSNSSRFVQSEVNRAFAKGKSIFTFLIEDVIPSRQLELYVARQQWLDGFSPPIEQKIDRLANAILALMGLVDLSKNLDHSQLIRNKNSLNYDRIYTEISTYSFNFDLHYIVSTLLKWVKKDNKSFWKNSWLISILKLFEFCSNKNYTIIHENKYAAFSGFIDDYKDLNKKEENELIELMKSETLPTYTYSLMDIFHKGFKIFVHPYERLELSRRLSIELFNVNHPSAIYVQHKIEDILYALLRYDLMKSSPGAKPPDIYYQITETGMGFMNENEK